MKRKPLAEHSVVYSTDHGRMCPKCAKPQKQCICAEEEKVPVGDGRIRISRSSKGRKGKAVSVITGLPIPADELKILAKELKKRVGAGGTVKGNTIEIQSEDRELLLQELKKKGFEGKLSGG